MLNTKTLVGVSVAFGLALAAVATESVGSVTRGDRAKLSFSRAVALPGVTLAPGTYLFEIVDAGHLDIVRVRNGRNNQPEFMGYTNRVPRPSRLKGGLSSVTFGEAPLSEPSPIQVWFPADGSDGRQFIY